MSIIPGFDATHDGIPHLPPGQHQLAGYSTGTPDIRWTDPDWAAHPGALRICQDWDVSEDLATHDADLLAIVTSDYLDVERGAATIADAGPWYRAAAASYHAGKRPGQRFPAIYVSKSQVTPLVNGLIAEGVTSGPRLVIADWNNMEEQDIAAVNAASGPFPLAGYQWKSSEFYDWDVWSESWLALVSKVPPHLVSAELVGTFSDGSRRTVAV